MSNPVSAQVWFFHSEPSFAVPGDYISVSTQAGPSYMVRSLMDFAAWFKKCHGYYDEGAMAAHWIVQEARSYQEMSIETYKRLGLQLNPLMFTEGFAFSDRLEKGVPLYAMSPRGLTVYPHDPGKPGSFLSYSEWEGATNEERDAIAKRLA